MKIRYAPLALACALMGAGAAQAASVTYNFGGTLESISGGLPSLMVGDSFAGSFTFESSSLDIEPGPSFGIYVDGFSFNVTVNGYSYSSSSSAQDCPKCGSVQIVDSLGDRFVVRSALGDFAPVVGPNLGDFFPYSLELDLTDPTAAVFNSDALPSNLALSSFGINRVSISFSRVGDSGAGAEGSLSYLTLSAAPPVPEASTSAMLALGVGALGVAARRRKGH